MSADWKITYFKPDRPGIFINEDSICFAADTEGCKDSGIIFYDEKGEVRRYAFHDEMKNGTLAGMQLSSEDVSSLAYNYYRGKEVFTDPYALQIKGLEKWGGDGKKNRETRGSICLEPFDWQGDEPLQIPYEDSIIYGVNVRAFTMHKSSKVKKNGTFEGIIEKLPYLKTLGITAVELMPCYEYEECMQQDEYVPAYAKNPAEDRSGYSDNNQEEISEPLLKKSSIRLNCWGFQEGYYFAPKSSYSASGNPVISFKTMVRELHKNGIEVMMHFYFPARLRQLYMLDVLKYWVKEYHVDGFRISSAALPHRIFLEDPVLKYTKLRFGYVPESESLLLTGVPVRNCAVDNQGFLVDMRRYLKGDEGLISQVIEHQKRNPRFCGSINYIADYNSFSLYDSVSYEFKHNEKNGEENRDGIDKNYSWNCGIEGKSSKKSIQTLRMKQMKNAMAFLLLSQGTPFIFSGDELANTRFGNNNPYCQDNETGWIKWKENKFSKEILDYTKCLIALRKRYRILHMQTAFQGMDTKGCGYPDISYHGVEAWRPDLGYMSRVIGITLCGMYAGEEDDFFYIGFNMHWESHQMALPKLPKGLVWEKVSDTSTENNLLKSGGITEKETIGDTVAEIESTITVNDRSVVIYQTKKVPMVKERTIKKRKARE